MIADSIDRKRLLIAIQFIVGAVIAALAVLSLTGAVAVWHIYLAAILLGSLQALNQPARVAMVADLVDQRTLLDAVAHFNAAVHIGRIIGPPLVGLVIDHWSISAALVINASCYAVSVVAVSRIQTSPRISRPASQPMLRNFVDGLVQIRRSPVLLTVIVLACSWGGFGMSHLAAIPAFAKDQLDSGAYEAGLLFTGVRSRFAGGQRQHHVHGSSLAVPVAAGLPGAVLRRPDVIRVVVQFLGFVGIVRGAGRREPGHRLAPGNHHPPVSLPRRGTRPGHGDSPLHARLPSPGSATVGRRRRLGRLAHFHQHCRRALSAGHVLVRPGEGIGPAPRIRSWGTGRHECW